MGKYEEALERAKAGKPIDEVFPELKESEDERIRTWIMKELEAKYVAYGIVNNEKAYKAFAWLEKQGEQKPTNSEKPKEWSEEDETGYMDLMWCIEQARKSAKDENDLGNIWYAEKWLKERLKSLRPQPKEEREPMEIKYGGKIYQVHGVRDLPGGMFGYIIEDEPGHYDCIMNPEEVLGGGYGVKQNGSPYPTKEATFSQPHWKPSEEQMEALADALSLAKNCGEESSFDLRTLYEQLKKL